MSVNLIGTSVKISVNLGYFRLKYRLHNLTGEEEKTKVSHARIMRIETTPETRRRLDGDSRLENRQWEGKNNDCDATGFRTENH